VGKVSRKICDSDQKATVNPQESLELKRTVKIVTYGAILINQLDVVHPISYKTLSKRAVCS
jgi:hypothetical protein